MSFFKKDLSAYPQPILVSPDPEYTQDSIADAVAEAIDSSHGNTIAQNSPRRDASDDRPQPSRDILGTEVIHENTTKEGIEGEAHKKSESKSPLRQSPSEAQPDSSSQRTARESQQQDATKLADGIMSLLGPIVQEMDFNIVSVRKSQTELEKEIERLMAELQLFMASSAAPPEVEPAVQKLVLARRQIMAANSTLKTVQDRVDRMISQLNK